ncbi:flagellar hook-length control protein FliK [Bosea sp. TWI1241]|uniref:flagellar hook-length control protein FliK n=1 Tax=Bosea sp. TWI1241 TaxID=3148904 RepID=UPI00320A85B6
MSTASVSRSAAPFDTAPAGRRAAARGEDGRDFVLPAEEPARRTAPTAPSVRPEPARARPPERTGRTGEAPAANEQAAGPEGQEAATPAVAAQPAAAATPAKAPGEIVAAPTAEMAAETKVTPASGTPAQETQAAALPAAIVLPVPVQGTVLPASPGAAEAKSDKPGEKTAVSGEEAPEAQAAAPAQLAGVADATLALVAPVQTTAPVAGEATQPAPTAGGSGVQPGPAQPAGPSILHAAGLPKAAGEAAVATPDAGEAQAEAAPAGKVRAPEAGQDTKAATAGQATEATQAGPSQPSAAPVVPPPVQAQPPVLPAGLAAPEGHRPEKHLPEGDAKAAAETSEALRRATAAADAGRPTPAHLVPIEIGARALAGNRRFDIRLDPAELGRVDVRLEISEDGGVSAKLTVDRVETLHLLQRDARTLERAFEQAGLKPSEGGVQMGLRDPSDQTGSRQQGRPDEQPRPQRAWVETSDDVAAVTQAIRPHAMTRLGGVDLSI